MRGGRPKEREIERNKEKKKYTINSTSFFHEKNNGKRMLFSCREVRISF